MKNYYEALGVPKNSSKEEIKRAYRRLAHQYHPDKKGGDEKKFKEINEAYQVLGDERKRAQYDQFGSGFGSSGAGGFSGFQGFDFGNFSSRRGSSFEGFDFHDIFSEFFGSRARGGTAKREEAGRDIYIDIVISLEDSYSGLERDISLKKYIQCEKCGGKKNEPGSGFKSCSSCGGSGELRQEQQTFLGSFARVTQCPHCAGAGKIPEVKCGNCKGSGRVKALDKIKVKIPAGIKSGEMISFAGKGEVSETGKAGNLYAQIHIKESEHFIRRNDDIYSKEEISIPQAVLGDSISVNTLGGECDVKIPAGTQSQDMVKLQGRGMPHLHGGGFGDHYVRFVIKTPKRLSKRAKELFEQLKKEL